MKRLVTLAIVVACGAWPAAPRAAETSRSAPLARDLVMALQGSSRDAIAAQDPADPARFVAALSVPGQLLVVRATHPSAAAIAERIRLKMDRDVYLDLQGTPTLAGKLFVQDAGADGLLQGRKNGGSVDVVYRDGTTTLRFDGDPHGEGLDDRTYEEAYERADTEYAEMLALLKAAATAATAPSGTR